MVNNIEFISMLEKQKSIQKLFNYKNQEEVKIHTKNIVAALVKVVQNCGNPENFETVLIEVNAHHVGLHI